jgi:hypothetical protein
MRDDREYVCRTPEDSDDVERVAAHYGLDPDALAAARAVQGSFSALGLAPILAAYTDALGGEAAARGGCPQWPETGGA